MSCGGNCTCKSVESQGLALKVPQGTKVTVTWHSLIISGYHTIANIFTVQPGIYKTNAKGFLELISQKGQEGV